MQFCGTGSNVPTNSDPWDPDPLQCKSISSGTGPDKDPLVYRYIMETGCKKATVYMKHNTAIRVRYVPVRYF